MSSQLLFGNSDAVFDIPTVGSHGCNSDFINQPKLIQQELILSYKDSFYFELDEQMTWKVFTVGGDLYKKGKGSIAGLVFSNVGEYIIDLRQPIKFGQRRANGVSGFNHSQCNHSPFPEEINLKVLPNYFLYDFESIEFSRPIVAGNWDGEVISVFADFESRSGQNLPLENLEIIAFGVGATLKGKLISFGNHTQSGRVKLQFLLQGELMKGTYIQLNFVDVNGIIQPYSLLEKIK
ncbi:hypothetical protein GCM10026987_08890 [Belliella aquatica]|uniref:Uncharacterized protein n=2 Tax=Belliella aquatica TaxID=1323734 RepID=A0ABQ1NAI7_9BACT|nr:hypothetical protein GCM10010993_36960 [Belliella aquatica]